MTRFLPAVVTSLLLLGSDRIFSAPPADITGGCPSTITQSSSQEITVNNSVSCYSGPPDYLHLDNSYWRAFNMASITGSQPYNVTSVSFGIELANSGDGTGQPVTVRLYTNSGGFFPGGSRTLIAAANLTVMDQIQTIHSILLAANVPVGTSELVMEVFTPSGQDAGNSFFIGSNAASQTAPSYITAPECGTPTPTTTAEIGFPDMHIVFNVHGYCGTVAPAKALNISTRLRVEPGDNAMIGGFIITGNAPKTVVLRGIGPSLAGSGINDFLADPVLALHGANGSLIYASDNWRDDPAQAALIQAAGFQPTDDRESAMIQTLSAGPYTAVLTGQDQTSGVGLVEVYDDNQAAGSQLANLSTRGLVQTGNNVMIGGFILGGNNGNSRVAIRGRGPSLSPGLSNVLPDPTLEVHDSNGTTVTSNDDWHDDPFSASQLSAYGLALQDDLESGIFLTLPAGTYTVILGGYNDATGVGLVEVYNLQ